MFFGIDTVSIALNATAFVFLIAAFVMLGYYFHRYRLIQRAAGAAKEKLDQDAADRILAERLGIEEKGFFKRLFEKPRQLFGYSGLGRLIPWLTFEIFIITAVISTCVVYIIAWLLLHDVFYTLSATALWAVVLLAVQAWLAHSNYKVTDKHLISFLNQLANFSTVGAVEVTEVFAQVARYTPYPIRDVLEECYAEAYTSGDSAEALAACSAKLEHPKFKEIIKNLESCMRYTADYKVVVDGMRRNILDERRSSQERKSMAASAITHMVIVTVMGSLSMFIASAGLGMPITDVMFNSMPGRASLVIAAVSYLVFIWNVARADR